MDTMYKSIYEKDLKATKKGLCIQSEAEDFFTTLMENYPECNPREMTELINTTMVSLANRAILYKRREE